MLRIGTLMLVLLVIVGVAGMAQGAEDGAAKAEISLGRALAIIGVALGAGLCVAGGGMAIAKIGSKCLESIARQPEAAGAMFIPMIIVAGMVEGAVFFGLIVCLWGLL